jgi:hypothetical protein
MKATVAVYWPGKEVYACEEHAKKLMALGKHMGFAVSVAVFLGDAECTNCANEAKKSER